MGSLSYRGKVPGRAFLRIFSLQPVPCTLLPHKGFTLIELILVLVIMGFLTALVGPAITSLSGLTLKTSARKVAAGLRYARSQAVTTGSCYQVTFNLELGEMVVAPREEDNRYRELPFEEAVYPPGRTGEVVEEELPPREERRKAYTLPKAVRFSTVFAGAEEIREGVAVIDFYPNGGCTGGEVVIEDEQERSYRILLDFITGIVEIVREEGI